MDASFEDAVARAGILAAWDISDGAECTISVFDLSGGGARQIAWNSLPWLAAADAVTVWSRDSRALEARAGVVTDSIGRTLPVSEIAAFVGYVDDDYVDRGIKAERRNGERVTVLYDLSMAASGNPTYSRNDLLMDTGWIHVLGTALARWVGGSASRIATRSDLFVTSTVSVAGSRESGQCVGSGSVARARAARV